MKNITILISILISLMLAINCSAQHVTDADSDKFAGTWKWGDSTNGVKFIMKKENQMKILGNSDPARLDGILGFQEIRKNGLIIDDFTMDSNTNFSERKYSFFGITGIHDFEPNILRTWGRHKGKSIEMKIEYIDANHIKIIHVQNMEGQGYRAIGQPPIDWSIDIPINIILTKQ